MKNALSRKFFYLKIPIHKKLFKSFHLPPAGVDFDIFQMNQRALVLLRVHPSNHPSTVLDWVRFWESFQLFHHGGYLLWPMCKHLKNSVALCWNSDHLYKDLVDHNWPIVRWKQNRGACGCHLAPRPSHNSTLQQSMARTNSPVMITNIHLRHYFLVEIYCVGFFIEFYGSENHSCT